MSRGCHPVVVTLRVFLPGLLRGFLRLTWGFTSVVGPVGVGAPVAGRGSGRSRRPFWRIFSRVRRAVDRCAVLADEHVPGVGPGLAGGEPTLLL